MDIHNLSFLVGKELTLHSEHLPPSWCGSSNSSWLFLPLFGIVIE
jgi:hypothetical protein